MSTTRLAESTSSSEAISRLQSPQGPDALLPNSIRVIRAIRVQEKKRARASEESPRPRRRSHSSFLNRKRTLSPSEPRVRNEPVVPR